jgi:hypothetical protein
MRDCWTARESNLEIDWPSFFQLEKLDFLAIATDSGHGPFFLAGQTFKVVVDLHSQLPACPNETGQSSWDLQEYFP